jgi:hypothetical protein
MERSTRRSRRPDGLEAYLRHLWLDARSGTGFAARVADVTPDSELRAQLGDVAREVAVDCSALLLSLASAGVRPALLPRVTLALRERLGRLGHGGSRTGRAAAEDVAELEALARVLAGTRLGWECIRRLAVEDPWWSHYASGHWLRRNAAQRARVEALHPRAVGAAFAPSGSQAEAASLHRTEGTAAP